MGLWVCFIVLPINELCIIMQERIRRIPNGVERSGFFYPAEAPWPIRAVALRQEAMWITVDNFPPHQ